MKFKRVLIKLSGEALSGNKGFGWDSIIIQQYTEEIKKIKQLGVEVAIVIGGGNIYRGMNESETGIERAHGDYMGMLATIINGMALQASMEKNGIQTRLLSNIKVEQVAETYIRRRAIRHLEKDRVVIFVGGTGNPYFTTDTAGVLKALEIKAEVIIKATKVDGIYDADPAKNPNAKKYDNVTFNEVLSKHLNIMDMTAFTLCAENKLPLVVLDINKDNNLINAINGKPAGTLVKE